jgi:predicted kinase
VTRASAIVHLLAGLNGAGKTTYARRLAAERPAVRFTLDEWMLRLHRLPFDDPRYAALAADCQDLIWDTALQVLSVGVDVVLDWNQWSRQRRATWRARAEEAGYAVLLHYLDVSLETAIARTAQRARDGVATAHVVDEAAVRHLERLFEVPSDDEGIPIQRV